MLAWQLLALTQAKWHAAYQNKHTFLLLLFSWCQHAKKQAKQTKLINKPIIWGSFYNRVCLKLKYRHAIFT